MYQRTGSWCEPDGQTTVPHSMFNVIFVQGEVMIEPKHISKSSSKIAKINILNRIKGHQNTT
jgi:hypothetical protein